MTKKEPTILDRALGLADTVDGVIQVASQGSRVLRGVAAAWERIEQVSTGRDSLAILDAVVQHVLTREIKAGPPDRGVRVKVLLEAWKAHLREVRRVEEGPG